MGEERADGSDAGKRDLACWAAPGQAALVSVPFSFRIPGKVLPATTAAPRGMPQLPPASLPWTMEVYEENNAAYCKLINISPLGLVICWNTAVVCGPGWSLHEGESSTGAVAPNFLEA